MRRTFTKEFKVDAMLVVLDGVARLAMWLVVLQGRVRREQRVRPVLSVWWADKFGCEIAQGHGVA